MIKKVMIFSNTIFIALLLACGDGNGNRNKDSQETPGNPVVKPSGDDTVSAIQLDSLVISEGNLNPEFEPSVFNYEAALSPDISRLNIAAHPRQGCSVLVNDTLLQPEGYSADIPIILQQTDLSILVSDKDMESVHYSLKIIRLEEKHVENYSFEIFDKNRIPSSWILTGSGEFKAVNEYSHSGTSSGAFTSLTGTNGGREILGAPVEIGQKSLNVSAWCLLPDMAGISTERIKISFKLYYFTDAECVNPASAEYATMTKTFLKEQGTWVKIKYERDADDIPSDARFVRIALRANYDSARGGTKNDRVYFDDISLQQ